MSQVVLITGASSGIGKRTALLLAARGYVVYAGTRTPEKFETDTENLHVIPLDITNTKSIQTAVQNIYEEQGHIDILVNNAGYGLVSTVEEVREE